MNYTKHYIKLINRSPKLIWNGVRNRALPWRKRDGIYREAHRVVPGCMGGKYTAKNTVYLTPEEHYVAHQLLIKIYPRNYKLIYAANQMAGRCNKQYGWLRRKFSENHPMKDDQRRNDASKRMSLMRCGKPPHNKGKSNPIARERMLKNNPMKDPIIAAKAALSKTGISRPIITDFYKWICLTCGISHETRNIVHNRGKKFCNRSCQATFTNKNRKGIKYGD